jgi:hypothetical protein
MAQLILAVEAVVVETKLQRLAGAVAQVLSCFAI